ncbi:hypothetical protein WR25_05651 [Diploscapter pachys]|uniref:Uncharacterized protein n=1 Tax=Diploscapter pachys TaxID=2018661 RepID=A0A2A2KGX8_9BILA|nr:hypothetical protein WR25_05651 [Diploscapter pachys]
MSIGLRGLGIVRGLAPDLWGRWPAPIALLRRGAAGGGAGCRGRGCGGELSGGDADDHLAAGVSAEAVDRQLHLTLGGIERHEFGVCRLDRAECRAAETGDGGAGDQLRLHRGLGLCLRAGDRRVELRFGHRHGEALIGLADRGRRHGHLRGAGVEDDRLRRDAGDGAQRDARAVVDRGADRRGGRGRAGTGLRGRAGGRSLLCHSRGGHQHQGADRQGQGTHRVSPLLLVVTKSTGYGQANRPVFGTLQRTVAQDGLQRQWAVEMREQLAAAGFLPLQRCAEAAEVDRGDVQIALPGEMLVDRLRQLLSGRSCVLLAIVALIDAFVHRRRAGAVVDDQGVIGGGRGRVADLVGDDRLRLVLGLFLLVDPGGGDDMLVLRHAEQRHTLRVAARDADVTDRHANELRLIGHQHQLLARMRGEAGDDGAVAAGRHDVGDALAATPFWVTVRMNSSAASNSAMRSGLSDISRSPSFHGAAFR